MAFTPEQDRRPSTSSAASRWTPRSTPRAATRAPRWRWRPSAHVLYSRVMRTTRADPQWPDRDRFVLSNGHASILQYSMLYLNGYGLELDDIKAFRQWESRTPGHPEAAAHRRHRGHDRPARPGLRQRRRHGDRRARACAPASATRSINHHTFVIAGDGCFMEGVSHEAASLAGHLGLGNLICVYDDNHITIDGDTALAYSDDVGERFRGLRLERRHLGEIADDCDALEAALLRGQGRHRPAVAADPAQPHRLPVARPHRRPRGARQPVHGRATSPAPRR